MHVSQPEFNKLVVFGDGLSDMGRWGHLTNLQYPPSIHGFFESRWTNGPVWVEHLAKKLNLELSFENNFAMGGSTTGNYNINEPLKQLLGLEANVSLPGMLMQVENYIKAKGKADAEALFILWAGGHDIGSYLDFGHPDLTLQPPSANIRTAIEILKDAGAKNIFVGNMPDMGNSPGYIGTKKQSKASELCAEFNEELLNLTIKNRKNGLNMYFFDCAAVFQKVGLNPMNFGFTSIAAFLPNEIIDFTNPLSSVEIPIPNKETGLNPNKFMNWWALSASAAMHTIIAEEAFKLFE